MVNFFALIIRYVSNYDAGGDGWAAESSHEVNKEKEENIMSKIDLLSVLGPFGGLLDLPEEATAGVFTGASR